MYAILTWWDGSVKVVETLDEVTLAGKLGISLEEDEVYDIKFQRKVVIPEGCTLEYSEVYPNLEGVDLDANKFI